MTRTLKSLLWFVLGTSCGGAFSAAYYQKPIVHVTHSVFRSLPGKTTIYQDRLVAGNEIEWRGTCVVKDCARIAASEPEPPVMAQGKASHTGFSAAPAPGMYK